MGIINWFIKKIIPEEPPEIFNYSVEIIAPPPPPPNRLIAEETGKVTTMPNIWEIPSAEQKWIDTNINSCDYSLGEYKNPRGAILFRNEEDAVGFKLLWYV
jgi:hypothetical protein